MFARLSIIVCWPHGTTVWWLALNLKGTSADLIKFILQGVEKNKQDWVRENY